MSTTRAETKYTKDEQIALAEIVGILAAETEMQAGLIDQMLDHLAYCQDPEHKLETARLVSAITQTLLANTRILIAAAFELTPEDSRYVRDPIALRDEYRGRVDRMKQELAAAAEARAVEGAKDAEKKEPVKGEPQPLPQAKIEASLEAPTTTGFIVPGTRTLN